MQKRDLNILMIAIVCGVLAFVFVMSFLKKSAAISNSSLATVSKRGPSGPLPIPNGMSALTLSSKEIENTPDLVSIGSFLDILGVVPNYEGKMELQTIVRSAQVINLDKKAESGINSFTIAISPIGAEVVSKAMAQGKIHLILRPEEGEKGVLQFGGVGFTEVIRGVDKDKSMRVEK